MLCGAVAVQAQPFPVYTEVTIRHGSWQPLPVVEMKAAATDAALETISGGGMFRLVSMPNYLGELVEWIGWAIATWSLAGLGFALFTAANLVPRAWSSHRWYREHYDDYPGERRAIIPFLF